MIQVVAGIIVKESRVLLARRKEGHHLAGYWEFPGGKIECGETPEECLHRELKEELAIDVRVLQFVGRSEVTDSEKPLCLLGYLAQFTGGDLQLNDHSEVRWVRPQEIADYQLAPADIPLVSQLLKIWPAPEALSTR